MTDQLKTCFVLLAIALPPPLHGQSAVNSRIASAVRERTRECYIADISPSAASRGMRYHTTRFGRVIKAAFALLRNARNAEKSFYTVFEAGAGVLYNTVLILAARMSGYKIYLHHHTAAHTKRWSLRFWMIAQVAGRRCVHVVLSHKMSEDLKNRYGDLLETFVLHNASFVRTRRDVQVKKRPSEDEFRLGMLSNLTIDKGLDIALDSVALARAKCADIRLLLAGPAATREASAVIDDASSILKDNLYLLGALHDDEKDEFYKEIDTFIFPTRYKYEAQPLVLLEAMSSGIPIITTDQGYIAELVGCDAILIRNSADACANAIIELHGDPSARAHLATNALKRFELLRSESSDQFHRLICLLTGG